MTRLGEARDLVGTGAPCTLVTIAETAGSAPREAGTRMLVWADGVAGTIGGGHLEFAAIERARQAAIGPMLRTAPFLEWFSLGPQLGQCCGGRVRLLFEPLSAADLSWLGHCAEAEASGENFVIATWLHDITAEHLLLDRRQREARILPKPVGERLPGLFRGQHRATFVELRNGESWLLVRTQRFVDPVYLFGAGHVGQALVRALEPLPYQVTWIDGRSDIFPRRMPANVTASASLQPSLEVDKAPPGTMFLVMTHSHPLDLEICERVLRRNDFGYLGLIGSATKRARFLKRLKLHGHGDAALARLVCPIGVAGITGKEPAVIAVAVATQLLQTSAARRAAEDDADGHRRTARS